MKAPQPEGGPRKKSFCARMSGMKKKLTSLKQQTILIHVSINLYASGSVNMAKKILKKAQDGINTSKKATTKEKIADLIKKRSETSTESKKKKKKTLILMKELIK